MKHINREEKEIRKLLKKLGLAYTPNGSDVIAKAYNRILTPEERKLMDAESFGYLLSLYRMGTIDSMKLERYIDCSLSIAYHEGEKLTLEDTKRIIGMLICCDNSTLRNKDLISLYKELEDELSDFDIIH